MHCLRQGASRWPAGNCGQSRWLRLPWLWVRSTTMLKGTWLDVPKRARSTSIVSSNGTPPLHHPAHTIASVSLQSEVRQARKGLNTEATRARSDCREREIARDWLQETMAVCSSFHDQRNGVRARWQRLAPSLCGDSRSISPAGRDQRWPSR